MPGLPTIYTVHLSAGRTVEIYADPGTAGPNEIHATFFDASGSELPVHERDDDARPGGRHACVPWRLASSSPATSSPTRSCPQARYSLAVSAPAPGGDELATRLDISIAP